jgi:hypothetical protein
VVRTICLVDIDEVVALTDVQRRMQGTAQQEMTKRLVKASEALRVAARRSTGIFVSAPSESLSRRVVTRWSVLR